MRSNLLFRLGQLKEYTAAAGSFAPSDLANLAFWYKKATGQTGSPDVSAWADQSGNSRNITQGTAGRRPTIQGDGSLLFNNATDDTFEPLAFTFNQPCTVCLRVKLNTWAGDTYYFDGFTIETITFANTGGGASGDCLIYSGGVGTENGSIPVGSYASIVAVFNDTASVLRIGATEVATGASIGVAPSGGLTVGSGSGGTTTTAQAQIMEIFGYTDAKVVGDRDSIITYLNTL